MPAAHAQRRKSIVVGAPRRQRGGLTFWVIVLLVLVGASIGAAATAAFVFSNVKASLLMTDAPATATVVEPFDVGATILNELDIALDDTVHTRVPVDKTLSVPVNEPLELLAKFDAHVPIQLNVTVDKTITINQKVDLDTVLQADLLGDTFPLAIRGDFPIKAEVPVNITIPVDQLVHLEFTAPIKARLKQDLKVPLDTVIEADVPLKTRMSVPINNTVQAEAELPDKPLPVTIDYADLDVPLSALSLSLADDTSGHETDDASSSDNARPDDPEPQP